jgi:uncharacterized protein YoxC
MKKLFIALLIVPFFVACNQKELKQLRQDKIDLTAKVDKQDKAINDFVESMNIIEENLEIIKKKESIIAVNAENPNQSQKQKIKNDLASINNLLEQNRTKISDLEKKLKGAWYSNSKLRKLTERLKADLAEKEAELAMLKDKLAKLNIEVDNLNNQVTDLNGQVVALNTDNEKKSKLISEQTVALNTGYYVLGTTRELKEKKVITNKGGFIGIGTTSKLSNDFNTNAFKKIDITKTTTIPVSARKISIVTNHPSSSYKVEGTGKVEGITILNPEEFWKSSKYLVVKVK